LETRVRGFGYTIEERPDDNPTTRAFVVMASARYRSCRASVAGGITHHLQASLDLLVYQLLLRNSVTDEKLLKKSVFPVVDKDLTTPQGRGEYYAANKRAIGPLPALAGAHRGSPARQAEHGILSTQLFERR